MHSQLIVIPRDDVVSGKARRWASANRHSHSAHGSRATTTAGRETAKFTFTWCRAESDVGCDVAEGLGLMPRRGT